MPTETFDPDTYGALLQRGYNIKPLYRVVEDERELGNVKSVAVAQKALRRLEGLVYKCPARTAYEYIASFLNRHVGPAGRFYYSWPEFVPSPDIAPTLEAVVAGAQASRTIFCKYAWKTSLGRTFASPAASLTVPLNNLLKVTLPVFPASVTEAVIYATQGAAGTEQEQTTLTNTRTWTQPDAALLTATASVPTSNTAREVPIVKLGGDFSTQRGPGQTYIVTLDLEETY